MRLVREPGRRPADAARRLTDSAAGQEMQPVFGAELIQPLLGAELMQPVLSPALAELREFHACQLASWAIFLMSCSITTSRGGLKRGIHRAFADWKLEVRAYACQWKQE